MSKVPDLLHRYTSIPDLLYMLANKRLLLSNPENWKDRTDYEFLKKYAGDEKVRAICFFEDGEKNHYWEIYAEYGCLIVFDKDMLLGKIPDNGKFRHKKVLHLKREDFNYEKHKEILPFIKQVRYKNENEYRVVWKGKNEKAAFISVDLNSIVKIAISGDIKEEYAKYLKRLVCDLLAKAEIDVKNVEIVRSELYMSKALTGKLNPKTTGAKQ